MTRHDYLTHIGIALFFFVVLSPFLLSQGDQFGVRIYLVGTSGLIVIATVARLLEKRKEGRS